MCMIKKNQPNTTVCRSVDNFRRLSTALLSAVCAWLSLPRARPSPRTTRAALGLPTLCCRLQACLQSPRSRCCPQRQCSRSEHTKAARSRTWPVSTGSILLTLQATTQTTRDRSGSKTHILSSTCFLPVSHRFGDTARLARVAKAGVQRRTLDDEAARA
jgi:hypothetical protein